MVEVFDEASKHGSIYIDTAVSMLKIEMEMKPGKYVKGCFAYAKSVCIFCHILVDIDRITPRHYQFIMTIQKNFA